MWADSVTPPSRWTWTHVVPALPCPQAGRVQPQSRHPAPHPCPRRAPGASGAKRPEDPVPARSAPGPRPRPQRPGTLCPPPAPPSECLREVLLSFQSFNFTCSQLPRAPLGRALKCAECGALSAADATSEAASNAMLVPLLARPSARPPGSARLSYILFVLSFFCHFCHLCRPPWGASAAPARPPHALAPRFLPCPHPSPARLPPSILRGLAVPD